jgi:hypothetical protein
MSLIQTAAPATEPLTLAEAKAYMRIDAEDVSQDQIILLLIAMAREDVQNRCRRSFVPQSWKLTLDKFPSPSLETSSANWYGPSWGVGAGPLTVVKPDGKTQYEIVIPMSPLQTIDSIKYYDSDGVFQTLAANAYLVDTASEPARVTPAVGLTWPSTQSRINSVEITFTAGFTTALPSGVKIWMLQRVADCFENREAVVMGARGAVITHPFFDRMLDAYSVGYY